MPEMAVRTLLAAFALVIVTAGGASGAPLQVDITYITQQEPMVEPLSLVEPVLEDEGLMGARQALTENQTTGQFLQHDYGLIERIVPEDGDPVAEFEAALAAGERLFIADLHAEQLLQLAPLADEAGALLFNARAPEDHLRTEACHESVLHVAPSRAMKADALAQYLIWKQWPDWFLMHGSRPADVAFADAIRRAAQRYGAKIVEEREYEFVEFARRTDTGHVQVQRQMPVLTQDVAEYDVLVVADESDIFGEYLPYQTWDPRPVAGTQGLVPTAWSRVHEQWGGTQVQRRFEKFSGRWMTERDYNAWLAVRIIGEAVTRTESAEAQALHDYMLADDFTIAAFKGEGLSFRPWNQQLRQPILLVNPRVLVSVSPQEQFLHQRTPLDTLGYDEPESDCRLN
jgi:ABC transporter substrate binding protein (PQQ-dependent alcohol dehydrogenase system)